MEMRINNSFEDIEEFLLIDFAVTILIDCTKEFLDVIISDTSRVVHVLEGITNNILHLLCI